MVVFITGGANGIGKNIALTFAKNGYDVAITYRSNLIEAQSVANEIEALGRKCVVIKADISKYCDIEKMFDEFQFAFDRLDVFINNAGVTKKNKFLETKETDFDEICSVDFKGAYFAMQKAAKLMIEKGIHGNIIAISSNNAIAHFADVAVYASVKTALTKLVEHIAIELAQYKIRANTIAPGWTDTGAKRLDAKEETYYKIPLNKWVEPIEISQTCLFLASSAANFINPFKVFLLSSVLPSF